MPHNTRPLIESLKAARQEAGLSQRAVAQKTGIDQSNFSKIETGKTDITLSTLVEIARALDRELMLVPRKFVPAVKTIIGGKDEDTAPSPRPAYQLDDEDDD